MTDQVRIGDPTLAPRWDLVGSSGHDLSLFHLACNHAMTTSSFDVAAGSAQGWPTRIVDHRGNPIPPVLNLPAGRCEGLWVVVSVPAGAADGTPDLVTASLVSQSNPLLFDLVIDTITVGPPIVLVGDRSGFGVPGSSVFYPHVLINQGPATTTFDLTSESTAAVAAQFWSDPNGDGLPSDGTPVAASWPLWPVGYTLPSFPLSRFPMVLEVTLAPDAEPGDVDLSEAIATSSRDGAVTASVTDRTEVRLLVTYGSEPPALAADTFLRCNSVHVKAAVLPAGVYRFRWIDPGGALTSLSPPIQPDASGALSSRFDLTLGDPVGFWTVALERNEGGVWQEVQPGGRAEFRLADGQQLPSGAIPTLVTDRVNYPRTTARLSLTASILDLSTRGQVGGWIEYTAYRDTNPDGVPGPGEPYVQLDGTIGGWSSGARTCRSTQPPLPPGGSRVDTACADIGPVGYDAAGTWRLLARWRNQCGEVIAERSTSFNVDCPSAGIDAGPDALICAGTSARIGPAPTAGTSYGWSPSAFLDNPNSAQPLASPTLSQTYTLSAIDSNGCSARDDVTVLVSPAPVADAGRSATICPGGSIALGTPAVANRTYSWSPNDGLDDPLAAQPMASPTASTSYVLTVTDTITGCAATDVVVVNVAALPVVDAGPDVVAPAILGPPTCSPGLLYQWSPTTDLDNPNACHPTTRTLVDTTYCVVVRHQASGCTSAPSCVDVAGSPCPDPPGRIGALQLVRTGEDLSLVWGHEPNARGGYRVYRAAGRDEHRGGGGVVAIATAADPLAVTGVDVAAIGAAADLYYRVVGVCGDGVTEGP